MSINITQPPSAGVNPAIGNRYELIQSLNNNEESIFDLIDLNNGKKSKIVKNKNESPINITLSPTEKYVTWYDLRSRRFKLYNIFTEQTIPLSKSFIKLQNWLSDDTALLVYDQYDIWKLNPNGNRSKCITNYYGKKHKIIFRILSDSILIAFNNNTKQNGFWKLSNGNPIPFTMDNYLYYFPTYPLDHFPPLKGGNLYLLQKENTNSSSLIITRDFQSFKTINPITSNKYQSYLIHHRDITGILYLPNSAQPFPLIITAYGKYSDNINLHLSLHLSEGTLNVPTYLSKGYAIFIPDIKTKRGHPGPNTSRIIIKSAKYLRKLPFIDKNHIGLQGFSFGGYITNYTITRTNLFTCAQSSSGPTDFISGYNSLRKDNNATYHFLYEKGQNNMGAVPWEQPKLYIKNSPVLSANKINTPLLIMHNENDNQVPWSQAAELFTALRRLQKPVWWLQYKNEGHQLFDRNNQRDFTIRQMEFFDHYLKGAPTPAWMDTLSSP